MSDETKNPGPHAGSSPIRPVIKQMLAVLIVGSVMGLAFNRLNPAGVHWSSSRANVGPRVNPERTLTPHAAANPDRRSGVPMDELFFNSDPDSAAEVAVSTSNATAVAEPPPRAVLPPPQIPAETIPIKAPKPITWEDAKLLLASHDVVLVDARKKAEYDAQHIPDAVSLPSISSPEGFEQFRRRYSTDRTLIVYCGDSDCPLSKKLAERLRFEFGYQDVHYMNGGFVEWLKAEVYHLPTTN